MTEIEPPECRFGYTFEQLERILGDRLAAFAERTRGSTGIICDGKQWNPMSQQFDPTGCGPHGPVVYAYRVERFLGVAR